MARKQCKKCPWKVTTNPHDIPHGYCEMKHQNLEGTIAKGSAEEQLREDTLRLMACHEFPVDAEKPCVGWLAHQLGPGNNIGLRLAAMRGRIDTSFELDGEQHETFEDTLP